MTGRSTIFVLVREGPSDDGLVPHLRELLVRAGADEVLGSSRDYPGSVRQRLSLVAGEEGSVDLVFVHRDADGRDSGPRRSEVEDAAAVFADSGVHVVPVIPVQELEAWLLLDEDAIREVVGRPSGRAPLNLPKPSTAEQLANPKEVLQQALLAASETKGRRRETERKRFGDRRRVLLERLDIDGPVSRLSAWQDLVASVKLAVSRASAPEAEREGETPQA